MTLPLTILGGYLGAGKTTLINRLLEGGHGKRLTVPVSYTHLTLPTILLV